MAVEVKIMTTDDLLALPDNGMEQDLIRGELRERPATKNPKHGRSEAKVCYLLSLWLKQQPEPRGELLAGQAGFRIRRNPDTAVGIDVAYISAELSTATPEDAVFVDGTPVLAVEILSPSDTQGEVTDKIQEYLDAGVALVWILEPVFRTVTVYQPDREPEFFNAVKELTGDPHLPDFCAKVAELFE